MSSERTQFVADVIAELQRQSESPALPSAADVFNSLSFDFPQIDSSAATVLNSAISQNLQLSCSGGQKCECAWLLPQGVALTPKFINGVLYCAANGAKQDGSCATEFAELGAVVLIKVYERALTLTRLQLSRLLNPLQHFQLDVPGMNTTQQHVNRGNNDNAAISNHDVEPSGSAIELTTPDQLDAEDGEVWASEEDPDDFYFEDGRDMIQTADDKGEAVSSWLPTTAMSASSSSAASLLEWAELRIRLVALSTAVSYNVFAALTTARWESLHLTASIFRIIRLLLLRGGKDNDSLLPAVRDKDSFVDELSACWPRFLFLLRDRMTDLPQSIPHILPAVINAARSLNFCLVSSSAPSNEPGVRGCCHPVVLGVLAALADDANVRAAPVVESRPLHDHFRKMLPHLAGMLGSLSRRSDDHVAALGVLRSELCAVLAVLRFVCSPVFGGATIITTVGELMRHGVVRSAVMLWLDAHANETLSTSSVGTGSLSHFLLSCVWSSSDVAIFAAQVPQLVARVRSSNFSRDANADSILWPMLLSACAPTAPNAGALGDCALHNLHTAIVESNMRVLVDFLSIATERVVIRRLVSWAQGFSSLRSALCDLESRLRLHAAESSVGSCPADEIADRQLAKSDRRVHLRRLVKRMLSRLEKASSK